MASKTKQTKTLYLRLEAFNQDGHQQVEQNVVTKSHKGNEVESRYRSGGCHAVI